MLGEGAGDAGRANAELGGGVRKQSDAGCPGWPYRFETLVESEPLVADLGPDSASPAAIFFISGSIGPADRTGKPRS